MAATDVVGARMTDDLAAWILALSGLGPPYEDSLNAPNIGQVPELRQGFALAHADTPEGHTALAQCRQRL